MKNQFNGSMKQETSFYLATFLKALFLTIATLSESDLNTAYPNAKDGFSVIAPNVIGGGKLYIKAGAGWVYQQILAVV